jgi:hypothetical protein
VTTTASSHRAEAEAALPEGSLFPAGFAVLLLTPGFFVTRVFGGLAGQRPWLGQLGTIATVAGVVLALVAIARLAWFASGARGAFASLVARSLAIAPVAALAFVAMFATTVSQTLQWVSLGGVAALVLVAGGRGVASALARKNRIAAASLMLLVAGETVELFGPIASYASRPGSSLPRVADALGRVSEASAFVGVTLAVVWALRRALAHLGTLRAMAFVAMPAAFTAVLLTLPARLPRTTEMVARASFGARFDLAGVGGAGHPSRAALMVYTLLFTGLIGAVSLSLATQSLDRGAGVRRGLGWVCVLLAGFGAVGIAGPMDPLRAVCVALGVLLLEQAAERE